MKWALIIMSMSYGDAFSIGFETRSLCKQARVTIVRKTPRRRDYIFCVRTGQDKLRQRKSLDELYKRR